MSEEPDETEVAIAPPVEAEPDSEEKSELSDAEEEALLEEWLAAEAEEKLSHANPHDDDVSPAPEPAKQSAEERLAAYLAAGIPHSRLAVTTGPDGHIIDVKAINES